MDKIERIAAINVRCTEAADLISLALDELDSGAEYLSEHKDRFNMCYSAASVARRTIWTAVEALNKLEAEELKKNGGAAV